MSLFESGDSSGDVSLHELFNNPDYHVRGESRLTIAQQVDLVCRGGWPGLIQAPPSAKASYIRDYYDGLVSADITDVDGIKRNPNRARAILRAYARGISTLTDYQTMVNDLANVGEGIDMKTFSSYVRAFEKLFIIENVEAWTPKLRSASKIRRSLRWL